MLEKNDNLEESFAQLRSQHEDLLSKQHASDKAQQQAMDSLNKEIRHLRNELELLKE